MIDTLFRRAALVVSLFLAGMGVTAAQQVQNTPPQPAPFGLDPLATKRAPSALRPDSRHERVLDLLSHRRERRGGAVSAATNPPPSSFFRSSALAPQQATPAAPDYGSWGFDLSGMDRTLKPGESFYDFANRGWDARTDIPSDRVRYGMFDVLEDRAQEQIRDIIEAATNSGGDPDAKRIGAFYHSFMDEARIEQLDVGPLADNLARIRAARTKSDLAALMGRMREDFGTSLFVPAVGDDDKDPTHYALFVVQSGLGLPDRDYYLSDVLRPTKLKYRDYLARLLAMIDWPDAQARADQILALETRIAEASWSRAESRDVDKTYNPMSPAELAAYAPGFPWTEWFAAAHLDQVKRIVIVEKTAFPKLAAIFADTPVETLQAWLAVSSVDQVAPYLSKRFAQASFAFRGTELLGQPEQEARWKRATNLVNDSLGEAIGREYVRRYFPPESRAKMESLVAQLKLALQARIEHLQWMTPETRAKALEKLSLFGVKIGYPNKWRDYSALEVDPGDLIGNVRRSLAFVWNDERAKLGKEIDRDEWDMTPQTVNAYYTATRNEIVFPAAILQAPFFNPNADMAVNYGAIGGIIGHEMTHGFDDQGRKSDGHGLLTDWWQPADAAKFDSEAAKYGAQFDSYSVAPGVNVRGNQTMGENIADLGGILVALDGYRASLNGQPAPVLDGFTGDQRVFLGWAQAWRGKSRIEALIQQVTSDPHSPERFRVNGPLRNIDAWYDAWGVKAGDALYLKPDDRVRIW